MHRHYHSRSTVEERVYGGRKLQFAEFVRRQWAADSKSKPDYMNSTLCQSSLDPVSPSPSLNNSFSSLHFRTISNQPAFIDPCSPVKTVATGFPAHTHTFDSYSSLCPIESTEESQQSLDEMYSTHKTKKIAKDLQADLQAVTLTQSVGHLPYRPVQDPLRNSKCSFARPSAKPALENSEALYQYPETIFSDILDIFPEENESYAYLAHPRRNVRAGVRRHRRSILQMDKSVNGFAATACSCAPKLYLHASLHYKQMFWRGSRFHTLALRVCKLHLVSREPPRGLCQVLVLHFEGVLGDCIVGSETSKLVLRDSVICGLLKLALKFRLVLVTSMGRRALATVVSRLLGSGVAIEAVYEIKTFEGTVPGPHQAAFLDYSRVAGDLSLADPGSQLLIVTRLDLAAPDIPGADLHYHAGTKIRLHTAFMPIPAFGCKPPISFLVPSILAQDDYSAMLSFLEVSDAVLSFASISDSSWVLSFQRLAQRPTEGLMARTTSAVHESLVSELLTPPLANSFQMEAKSHSCELHRKLVWRLTPLHHFSNNAVIVSGEGRTAPLEVVKEQSVQAQSLMKFVSTR